MNMAFKIALIFLVLLQALLAFVPLSGINMPIKTGLVELRPSLEKGRMEHNVFQVPQYYRQGDRLAYNVVAFSATGDPNLMSNKKMKWEVRHLENQNQVTFEVTGLDQQIHWKAQISYIIIGKQLEEKAIFLQSLRINQVSTIKNLENNILLTSSSHLKLNANTAIDPIKRNIFILYRGFDMKDPASSMISLKGYFVDNNHIHVYNQLHGIANCYITVMIIDRSEIARFHLELFILQTSEILRQTQNSLILTNDINAVSCPTALSNVAQQKCLSMRIVHSGIQFKKMEKIVQELIHQESQEQLDDEGELFVQYGRNRLLSGCSQDTCSCSPFPYATYCYEDKKCNCKIVRCGPGYYASTNLTSTCTPCPTNLTNCYTCAKQFGSTNITCTACNAGYVAFNGICAPCPTGCATCTTITVSSVVKVTCVSCVSNLLLQTSGSVKVCGCASNKFLNTAVSPVTCVNCPTACLSCTSLTVCSTCIVGYYLSGTTCVACMAVCKTCLTAATCATCFSTATLVSNVCTCPASTFFHITTKTCLTCNTIQPNCQTCNYSLTYDPVSPAPVICYTAPSGYYVNSNGSAVACVSHCTNCDLTPTPVCSTCQTNFAYDGVGSCICGGGLYFSVTQNDCLACGTVIPGCTSCQTNTIPTATTCLVCNPSGYFLSNSSCTACPSFCQNCTSLTACGNCINNLTILSGMCGCDGNISLFLSPTTQSCMLCSSAIFSCQTCAMNGSTVICSTCSAGYYPTTGSVSCYPCPGTCSVCTSATVCSSCQLGYTLSNSSCICSTNCTDCLSNSSNTCSSCTYNNFTCLSCAVGYYDNLGTCTACTGLTSNCAECTNSTCLGCSSPFLLSASGCACDNSAGLYLSLNSSTCLACIGVIPDCQTCTGSTTCSACLSGYFSNSPISCLPCGGACLTCSTTSTHCLTCLVTYTMVAPNNCGCDNTTNYYYDPSTTGCSLCTTIITNCLTCSTTLLVTTCAQCSPHYFWNSSSSTCDSCSSSCTTCSSSSVCTGCPNNLVLSETVGYFTAGLCVCDNSTLPLTYYDSASGTCQPCSYFYTTCTACYISNSTVLCSAVTGSTYLVNNTVQNCPSPCSTCDLNGCLTCPTGMNASNGSCICDTSCTQCQTLSIGCVSCTVTAGAITACSQCLPGTYLVSPSCNSCPSTCATCTSSTTCLTCQSSYVLTGGMCSCATTLGIFPDSSGVCTACSSIFYACNECQIISGSTACIACQNGYFVQSGQCEPCNTSCLTCEVTASTCTSCATGQTLTSGSCVCSTASCLACNVTSPNCVSCIYTIYGNFSKCGTCSPDYYLNGVNCSPCPSVCQTCGAGGACLTCPSTFQIINGTCLCNSAKGMWESGAICIACNTLYPNCANCNQNTTAAINVSCTICDYRYYLLNGTCAASVCGDSIITSGETCDDGNSAAGDGCSDFCEVQPNFNCTGTPSICTISINFYITLESIITSKIKCNQFTISFTMNPVYSSYDSANFGNMLTFVSEADLTYLTWSYSSGIVSYSFSYSSKINKQIIFYYFTPSALAIAETASIPIIVVEVAMYPTNNVQLIHYDESTCRKKQRMRSLTKAVEYASYGTLILSALPCKIVGLQLFGVLQLAHINVGNMDYVNTMMTPLMDLKGVHGFSANLGNEPSKSRLLQATTYTPNRVKSIGYESNFLRNCNVMLFIVVSIILVSLCLYLITFICQKCAPCLHSISKRIIKQVLLTLILFNCFNFAYSAGLHFNYAPKNDSLYLAGTVAAILSIVVPLLMAIGLMCAEDEGFGEYKEKFKPGLVDRLYFVVTILYRTGIGLYISTANEDSMSTLIVMGLSIAFLLYNLVNLPYTKAYHNYRANVCHFAQFICLFVAMYYRSMMSTTSASAMGEVYAPVYLQMAAITLSLVVSLVVLAYEIYLFVLECTQKKEKLSRVSDGSSQANDKHISEGNLESFTNEKKFSFEEEV